ncbi:MAG TPA: hypothetical protein VMT46_11685 [Anaerolineaceae bacterium]|nr:hypothetical protein [Anaerolineaceae bacterium]
MDKYRSRLYYERNLPHYHPPGAILFVTFRLAGSIPVDLLDDLNLKMQATRLRLDEQREALKLPPMVLAPSVRNGVEHVSLAKYMHSLKGYTGKMANKILGRNGDFWQHESYDHVVWDQAELRRIVEYVLENPVKAGLVLDQGDWKWSFFNGDWDKED